MTAIALHAIHAYRRHVSPIKGFRCAHNALHGAGSCSDFGLRAYARHDWRLATSLLLRRFRACRFAHASLIAARESGDGNGDDPERRYARQANCIDAANCACMAPDLAGMCDCGALLPF